MECALPRKNTDPAVGAIWLKRSAQSLLTVTPFLTIALLQVSLQSSAEACSPSREPHAAILWPGADAVVPTDVTVWLAVGGLDHQTFRPRAEIVDASGRIIPVTFAKAPPLAEQYTPSGLGTVYRAQLALEEDAAYTLRYVTSKTSSTATWNASSITTGASQVAPEAPRAELGFWRSGFAPWIVSSCSSERANEFAIVFPEAASNTTVIHARAAYGGSRSFEGERLFFPGSGNAGIVTFWASDRGVPCVELVAEGPSGLRSPPTVLCEPIGCSLGSAESAQLNDGVDVWRRLGPASCEGVLETRRTSTSSSSRSVDEPTADVDSAGCKCTSARFKGPSRPTLAWLLAGLAALLRVRAGRTPR